MTTCILDLYFSLQVQVSDVKIGPFKFLIIFLTRNNVIINISFEHTTTVLFTLMLDLCIIDLP